MIMNVWHPDKWENWFARANLESKALPLSIYPKDRMHLFYTANELDRNFFAFNSLQMMP
jgi:hypothetical protein